MLKLEEQPKDQENKDYNNIFYDIIEYFKLHV
jgi:hypothetical protein